MKANFAGTTSSSHVAGEECNKSVTSSHPTVFLLLPFRIELAGDLTPAAPSASSRFSLCSAVVGVTGVCGSATVYPAARRSWALTSRRGAGEKENDGVRRPRVGVGVMRRCSGVRTEGPSYRSGVSEEAA
jgi:hypothetical protein